MATFSDFHAIVVTPVTNGIAIPVPQTPAGVGIAEVRVNVPHAYPNFVEIKATIGVTGNVGTGSLLFRLFRDGQEIYYGVQGIESDYEQFALVTLQAIDVSAPAGSHGYTLSIEKLTAGLTATVIGPLNLSATVFAG